jgi:hypothetical protein
MSALMAAVIAAGATGAGPAAPAFADSFTITSTVEMAIDVRGMVRDMSWRTSLPPEVRSEAYVALRTDDEAKMWQFLKVGYPATMVNVRQRERFYEDLIRDYLRAAIPGSEVEGSATEALAGSRAAQYEYVQSGYDRARELDRANNNQRQERLARLAKEDRDYVTFLAGHDPGASVQAAAQRAIAGNDRSIGLFFKYDWKIAMDLDREIFLRAAVEQNQIWLVRIKVLTESALAAEQAERESSDELARKYRMEAKDAWEAIDRESGQSSVDWQAAKAKADAQAAAWAQVAAQARNSPSEQDWADVLRRANDSVASWQEKVKWAQDEAAKWQAITEKARKAAKDAVERDLGDR